MAWMSILLGRNKQQEELELLLEPIRKIVEDESTQNELLHPAARDPVLAGEACDEIAGASGPFGYSKSNPIPVNGALGQLAYLSKLQTVNGQRVLFHRLGSIDTVDVFELVSFDGSQWFILYTDLYHPRKSRHTPDGFRFTKEFPQFSGFQNYCKDFPYDFIEMKQSERNSVLSLAYIAISRVAKPIEDGVYKRPVAHQVKLDLVRSKLWGLTEQ